MNSKFLTAACAAVFSVGLLAGCTQESKENMDAAGDNMARAAEKTGENVGDATANAAMTGKIKSALMGAEGIDSEHINVDTMGKTVMLKGSIDTEAGKTKAEQIAKDQAGADYTIDNQLTIGHTPHND